MKEEKNSPLDKIGRQMSERAKEQAKKGPRKIIKKTIAALAATPILLKFLIVIIITIILTNAISWVLNLFKSSESKEVIGGALEYSYISYSGSQAQEEKNGYKIIPSVDTDAGGYRLNFSLFDEEKNEVSEGKVLKDIRDKLEKQNISYSELTDTDLKIIAVLEKNGLDLSKYNQEELKCLPMFIKAEIATQNLDIRENKEEVNIEDILENDLVYGTIDVQRTIVGNNQTEENTFLKYMEYENFKSLEETKNIEEAKKYFSIDEEGNLIVAKWSTKETNVKYLDVNGKELTNENKEKIPEENKVSQESQNTVTILPIDYKNNVNKYSLNYGFLSDLLITTKNAPFCAELCKVAFNSKIIIDFREETTIYNEHTDTTYKNIDLTCDYAKYEITGTHSVTGETTRKVVTSGEGNPEDSAYLRSLGWNSNISHTIEGRTTTYTWTKNGVTYQLVHIARNSLETWGLYMYNTETSSDYLPMQSNMQTQGDGEIIIGGQEEGFENTNYTNRDEFTYTVHVDTYTISNRYDYEISEIDCWFTKYKKQYNTPTIETTPNSSNSREDGIFERTEKVTITEQTQIDQKISESSVIENYIKDKEQNYKNNYEAENVENVKCTIRALTEEIWKKEDITYTASSETVKYKFGEAQADTTEISLKNVIYTEDGAEFEEESTDVGFLSIYDKYLKNGEDLYLKQDAEKGLFEMLEDDDKTRVYSDLLKGLLYSYDHIDRGVTDLSGLLDVFKVREFKTARSSIRGLAQYLHQFGGTDIALTVDGMEFYKMYSDNSGSGVGNPTIGFGDTQYRSNHEKFNKEGYIYNKQTNKAELVNVETYINQKLGGYNVVKTQAEMDNLEIYVEKEFCDSVANEELEYHYNQVLETTSGLDLSQQQLYALTYVKYAKGNINYNGGFVSAYTKALEQYEKDSPEMNKYIWDNYWCKGFNMTYVADYPGWLKGMDASFETYVKGTSDFGGPVYSRTTLMFYTREQLRECSSNYNTTRTSSNEEEIFTYEKGNFADGLLGYAQMIHDYMAENKYCYCLLGKSDYEYVHKNLGLSCGLASNFEQSTQPGQYGYRLSCCATYVSWVLQEAGLIDEHSNNCTGLKTILENNNWTKISNSNEIEPGDIVFYSYGHTNIYVGDGYFYDAGSNGAIQAVEPQTHSLSDFECAYRQP